MGARLQVTRTRGLQDTAPTRMLLIASYTDKPTVSFSFYAVSNFLLILARPLWIWKSVGFVH